MAKYQVQFSCGHTQEVQLFGKNSERERKIEWYETSGVCSDCYKEQEKEKISKKSEGLPNLEGSEKQIAWANKIRLTLISAIQDTINGHVRGNEKALRAMGREKALTTLKEKNATQESIDAVNKAFDLFDEIDTVKTTTSATWIIENRI